MSPEIERRSIAAPATAAFEGLPALLARVYAARGVAGNDDLRRDLEAIAPPSALAGIDRACERLAAALAADERILVVGDFDADGATSCALAVLALRALGARQVDYLVPNRFEFGYGLTPEIVAVAGGWRPDLIVTVDNGISSIDGIAAAEAGGIDVIVTDHHLPGDALPPAAAIVNPNQPGCPFPSKALAGVGVIFYVMAALRRRLRDDDWFARRGIAEPNLARFLDLVALGTVADVVPLDRNNRALVHQGLLRIRSGQCRPGIRALLEVAGRDYRRAAASDLGFAVGPRLNAAGRLDDMTHGIQCLLARDPAEAAVLAGELDALNRERRGIEQQMQQEALAALQRLHLESGELPMGLCLYDAEWHQGVIGIVAARIKERYHRPVIAFADAGDGEIKGSARSIAGFHIRDALDAVAAHHPGLVTRFGGHAMAAGLTLARERLDDFSRAFDAEVSRQLVPDDLRRVILSDGDLAATELDLAVAEQLREGGPWGQHFPEPVFDGEFLLLDQRLVGERHLKMTVAHPDDPQRAIDVISFNVDLRRWPDRDCARVRLAYRLDVNEWRGRVTLQLVAEHLEAV